jgi:chromosome segregation ATPase
MNELKENEKQVGFLKSAVPVYDTYIRLEQHEIPKLEDDMKTASAKLADAAKGIDQRTTAVGELKVQIKTLENLKRPVQDIARYTKEVEDLTREIGRLEAQLGESGGALSGAEIREKMDSLNEQRSKLSKESKAMAVEKEKARVRIQGLKDQLSNIRWRLGEGENKVNAKKTFQRDLEEAQTQLRKAQEDVKV